MNASITAQLPIRLKMLEGKHVSWENFLVRWAKKLKWKNNEFNLFNKNCL